jgi:hypothetical protein
MRIDSPHDGQAISGSSPVPISPPKALVVVVAGLLGLGLAAPGAATAAPGDPPSTARISAVFPLTVPESRTALLSATTLTSYTSPTGVLTRELDAVADTPVAIGIDPMILASIRALGTGAPASAVDWLDRLDAASNETFALTYADSDITLPLQAGAAAVLAPGSFDFAIDPGVFATPGDPSATADPTVEPTSTPGGAPELPTAESLVAWDYTISDIAWPVADTVIATDLATIGTSGYTTTILGSSNVQRFEPARARATVSGASTVVTDDALSALFASAINAPTLEEWQAALGPLQAAVDATAAQGGPGGASVVLTADRSTLGSAARLGDTLAALEALPSSAVVPFTSVLAEGLPAAELIAQPQSPESVAAAQSLLAAEGADASFSSVAANPVLITGERRLRLLATLSNAWRSYPGGRTSAVALYLDESAALHEAVRVVKSSDITLVADRASLPVTISNSLDQPVTVLLSVTAPSPVLEVEERSITVTIEPDSQKVARVPVQSLSNGVAQIAVVVTSTTGVPVGAPTSVRINVYAGWETPITVALAVIVFLIFVFGIARVIVRRRRARTRETAADTAEDIVE